MTVSDYVFDIISDQGSEDLVFLYDDGTYKDVLVGIARIGVQECTGEYFSCKGKTVWLKRVNSAIPNNSFKVHAIYSKPFTKEEEVLYRKWRKDAE